jgi:outer membrane receptor protein involved in Fe transport
MRTIISKRALLATTLLSGLAFAGSANAQDPNAAQDPNVQSAPTDQTPATQENPADTPAVDSEDATGNTSEIVVTGSRIASPNITSLSPVQVIGETEIDQSGAINVQDILLDNPAVGTPLFSRTNSAFSTSGGGAATIDLRDMGSNRTLVLINSRRVAGGLANSAIVDLNVIPTQFVERIDILTGGASSLYGSDAVAGVVNFIYKRNFEGVLAEGQYGITQRGDSPNYQVSLTAGANVSEGRGNIMIHVGYTNEGELLSRKRKDTRVDNRSLFWYVTGDPDDYFTNQVPFFSSFPPQGRFTTGGRTFTFGPTGDLQPCFTSNATTCSIDDDGDPETPPVVAGAGPNGFNRQFFRTLAVPNERHVFAAQGHYDITDNITAIMEGTYVKTDSAREIEPFAYDSGGANPGFPTGVVPIETILDGVVRVNPFVPQEILDIATDSDGDGLRDMVVARRLVELGTRFSRANRDFFRFVVGLEGKVFNDRFNWDVTYNIGRMTEDQFSNGQYNLPLLQAAQIAVQETDGVGGTGDLNGNGVIGDIVCADPLRRAEGCVPINMFGAGSITPEAAQYVAAELGHQNTIQQQVWAANLSGSLFDLPAGPFGIALGAEYRKEKGTENWDALTNAGLTGGNALPDTRGKFTVKELYGEVNVPVLADQPFAHELNLRAAGRLSDYSTVGSVKTWSLGADYAPIEAVRFRGTYAQAVRAPNIGELFTGPSQTFPTGLTDPCVGIGPTGGGELGDRCRAAPGVLANIALNGVFTQTQPDQQGISGLTSGNPNLNEETAKSLTAGVVFAPRNIEFLRNFVLSVDYYRIKVADAINFPGRSTILEQCYEVGNPVFCEFIVRRPAASGSSSPGSIAFVNSAAVNSGGLKASGIDTVLQYRTGLDRFMGGLNMNARISWTHLLSGWVIDLPTAPKDHFAGEIGSAKDRVNANVGFNTEKWGISFTGNYIGESLEDDASLRPLERDVIKIPEEFYLDTQVTFTPTRAYEMFLGIDNVFDNKAPNIYQGSVFNITGSNTAADVYDIFGRRFYAGARLRF